MFFPLSPPPPPFIASADCIAFDRIDLFPLAVVVAVNLFFLLYFSSSLVRL